MKAAPLAFQGENPASRAQTKRFRSIMVYWTKTYWDFVNLAVQWKGMGISMELPKRELKRRLDVIKQIIFTEEKIIPEPEKIVIIRQLFEQDFYSEEQADTEDGASPNPLPKKYVV